ncbi:MAG TPA: nicotinate-nucleotide adenylyltransferase [Thermoanaerobacterales bacterium]|nr:nicotinate-nucleotide adenylyltransferase [Thermoanaerobacterales bacterium]
MAKIGIMGGTFDPIHYGHLVTAEAVRSNFGLDIVLFVPTGRPPHKKTYKVTDSVHRYLMTVLATVTNPFFEVSRVEIDREGFSYTVDTIKELKEIYGESSDLYFISGADAILEIITWKRVDELLDLCYFVAATRPGYELKELDGEIDKIRNLHEKQLFSLEVPAMAISSTDIRKRVKEGRSIKYLLPESVEYYIKKNKLYKL